MQDLHISVADLIGRPGEYRDFQVAPRLNGVGVGLARLAPAPLRADLRAESVVEGVLVTGSVDGGVVLRCARCLRESHATLSLDVCELFAPPHAVVAEEEEAYRFEGTDIDLEPMLRDAATLALPLNPVCRADCRGLCAACGRELNLGPCDCVDEDLDPRWAALGALRERLKRES